MAKALPRNAVYAQSGGVTAVINTSACGVIETARKHPQVFGKVFAGRNGILGILAEELIDTSLETDAAIRSLYHTPGGCFGSCRYKLKGFEENKAEYQRLISIFEAHNIGYFFYNGGGDSQDTANKVSEISEKMGYPITCIGIPKTIDNDLPFTDSCPGFGSVAKYVGVSIREAGLDVASMCSSSTKVFILEVMGRHAGWIAAASGLASDPSKQALQSPHIILFPEIAFDEQAFCNRVKETVNRYDYCSIVVSEGLKNKEGVFLSESGSKDAFGHAQLGGVAPRIAEIIKKNLGYKYHWAVSDYLQRSARHIASLVDVEQAYALGKAAVEFAIIGKNAIMPIIIRESSEPYRWRMGEVALKEVANQEKKMPRDFISDDGFFITEKCREYIKPLIQGEAYPPYKDGLPDYVALQNKLIAKVLPAFAR
jgi:6-phosphofructokinase